MKDTFSITVTKTEVPPLSDYLFYLKKIWSARWLSNDGDCVKLLEKNLTEYLRIRHLLTVANGTLALQLAIKALHIRGEVITTPFTFPATTNSILWEGATPVFADIDPETYTLDPDDVERKITPATSAILAVHVYGNPCYMEDLARIARKYKIHLLYDAAHAFGVEYKGTSVLKFGTVSTVSFHATKIFSTAEGGAIIVSDKQLYSRLRLLRNFGIASEEEVLLAGTNAKMNELSAAFGLCNLRYIDGACNKRKTIDGRYRERLKRNPGITFQTMLSSKHNYSYMPLRFKNRKIRDSVYLELIRNDIKPRKYFYPLTSHHVYLKKLTKYPEIKNHPIAARISNCILCVPIYPSLPLKQVERIAAIINRTT